MAVTTLLRTTRLVLRRLTADDLDDLIALDADPEVTRFITGGLPTPPDEARARLEAWLAMYGQVPPRGFWAAQDAATGQFLGWFHLRPDRDSGDPELGYRLRRPAWGRGLATEGSRALIDLAFADEATTRVVAKTLAVNQRSRRVMQACGMRLVRAFHGDYPVAIPGDELGDVEYAISREEWAAPRRPGANTLQPCPTDPAGSTPA
jgi:RimJ/RimL family protein N-acetyltransferase